MLHVFPLGFPLLWVDGGNILLLGIGPCWNPDLDPNFPKLMNTFLLIIYWHWWVMHKDLEWSRATLCKFCGGLQLTSYHLWCLSLKRLWLQCLQIFSTFPNCRRLSCVRPFAFCTPLIYWCIAVSQLNALLRYFIVINLQRNSHWLITGEQKEDFS